MASRLSTLSTTGKMKRIIKEMKDIDNDTLSEIQVWPTVRDDLDNLTASFKGPSGTPYEGGTYIIDIKIPSEYPFKPPVMRFKTKIWHCNVSSQTGAICLDTLGTAWSPVLTIKSTLLSLQSLLCSPEPSDPQDAMVAKQMMDEPKMFAHVAREWAYDYANAPRPNQPNLDMGHLRPRASAPQETKPSQGVSDEVISRYKGYNRLVISSFTEMGFEIEPIVAAFIRVGIDRHQGDFFELEPDRVGEVMTVLLGEH